MNPEDAFVFAHRRFRAAVEKLVRASERAYQAPVGTSRARRTTLTARWKIAAEARDRVEAELREQFRASQRGAA